LLYPIAVTFRACDVARTLPTPLEQIGGGPLVLFLRSFTSDGRVDESEFFLGSRARSEEEQLALALQAAELGQFVALARPDATLHELGPDHIDIGARDWHDVVSGLLSRATVVVMRLGNSSNMRWELDCIVDADKTERTLFLLPFFGTEEERSEEYLQFFYTISEAGPHYPRFPPSVPSAARAMFFDQSGEPQIITEPTRGRRDISDRLAPFFGQLGLQTSRIRRLDAELVFNAVVRACVVCYVFAYLAADLFE
jgi:hypothetical protein